MTLDFLDVLLENTFVPIYGVALVVALIYYPKYYNTPLKYLPILFVYTFLNELLGVLIYRYDLFSLFVNDIYSYYTWVIYNIYNIVFYLYFYYVFWCFIENENHKKFIGFGGIFFIVVSLINPFFQNFLIESQVFAYVVGGLALLLCTLLYFLQLCGVPKTFYVSRDILFWLSIGLSIFYVGYLPIKIVRYFNAAHGFNEFVHLRKIHLSLILIMYVCFIIGFLRMRRILSK